MIRSSSRRYGGVTPGVLLQKNQDKLLRWRRGWERLSPDALLIKITRKEIKRPSQVSLKETIQFLIKDGANINVKINAEGDQLIHCLAAEGRYEAIRGLSECEADVCVETNDGGTPLLIAARHNHADVIHVLSQCEEVDVNAQSRNGWTPIQIAVKNGNQKAMDTLILCGATSPFEKD